MRDIYYVWAEGRRSTEAVASGGAPLYGCDLDSSLEEAQRLAADAADRCEWGGYTIVQVRRPTWQEAIELGIRLMPPLLMDHIDEKVGPTADGWWGTDQIADDWDELENQLAAAIGMVLAPYLRRALLRDPVAVWRYPADEEAGDG